MGKNPQFKDRTGVRIFGKRQKRLIKMMYDNDGVWKPEWKLYYEDKKTMERLVQRGVLERCRTYPVFNTAKGKNKGAFDERLMGMTGVETYQFTRAFREGLVS